MKLELLTNATVVNDAMKFAHESNDKLKPTKKKGSQDSEEPDDKKDSDKQGEEKHEEETVELGLTTNQIF
jgi:hypothetical protein